VSSMLLATTLIGLPPFPGVITGSHSLSARLWSFFGDPCSGSGSPVALLQL
jgi:hypothetical protein